MSWRDLREKYGQGKSRELLNRAIRAEVPGGAELIDACHKIGVELHSLRRDRQPECLHDLRKAHETLTVLLDRLRDGVCRRYGVGPDREDVPPSPASPVVRLNDLAPSPPKPSALRLETGGRKKIAWTTAVLRLLAEQPDNARVSAKLGISVASIKTARSRYKTAIAAIAKET